MTDKELIKLITQYSYLKRKIENVSLKIQKELEERKRNEQIQL